MDEIKQIVDIKYKLDSIKRDEIKLVKQLDSLLEDVDFTISYQRGDGWLLMNLNNAKLYTFSENNITKLLNGDINLDGGL